MKCKLKDSIFNINKDLLTRQRAVLKGKDEEITYVLSSPASELYVIEENGKEIAACYRHSLHLPASLM